MPQNILHPQDCKFLKGNIGQYVSAVKQWPRNQEDTGLDPQEGCVQEAAIMFLSHKCPLSL